ncbi:hypothetical protein BUALT_Bualt10G0097300 [Buddleja alternifolia]|uniref:Cytochrome P450 n=1 Tax=Buddleja alternifolia TaxID=168488 RepID=A0AAV6WY55_9LAMI|nr:hypothetical protein BUALT_Bualt10G0097300 [Buddleja alternifolia]
MFSGALSYPHRGFGRERARKRLAGGDDDLFVAGSDTTRSTTEWTMTELLLNPEKMSIAKHELMTIIGENSQVQESDISRLLYLQAMIKEVFRYHLPGPLLTLANLTMMYKSTVI